MTTGADIIGQALAQSGCTHAFGIPGGEVLALMEGLDRAGLTFILTKHENAAGFMAEGLWHATGAPGVLVATLGPGVANAVNTVANAHQDKVPLIFLTGCIDRADAESYTHQIFDHQALLRPVTKASFRARRGAVGATIAKAIAIATEGQPGPVHIDVPIGVAEAETAETTPPLPTVQAAAVPVEDRPFRDAVRHLNAATRPLAIAGVDAVNEKAAASIRAFCEAQQIPLITTYKGKGLIDEAHPLSLGGAGLSPRADTILKPLIDKSDCVLLMGYDPIEMRIGWRDPWAPDKTVIEITQTPRAHGMHHVSHTLPGRVGETLAILSRALAPPPERWPDDAPAQARSALAEAFKGPETWGPHAIFRTLRAAMPPETVITADSGAHRILLSQIWPCPAPRTLLQSSALCTMACAVPIAAGHALGKPDIPALAFVGDAGLEMGPGELATFRDLGLNLTICVLVDESLTLIEMKQRASQRPNLGVDFGGTDFPALARAFGGHGIWIDDAATLAAEARIALDRQGVTLLACRIGRRAYDGAF